MADLDLQLPPGSGMYPNIPTDSKGLIRKFQKNVELSYTKWKGYSEKEWMTRSDIKDTVAYEKWAEKQ